MFAREGRGTGKAGFFGIAEKRNDITGRRGTRAERAHRFEERRHSGTIVASRRPRSDSVVVRNEQDSRPSAVVSAQSRNNIENVGRDWIAGANSSSFLDLRF
jgi:hypothetical protein